MNFQEQEEKQDETLVTSNDQAHGTRVTETPSRLDPLVGNTFADKFFIEAVLGRGGMGVVYLARHLLLKKQLAIKTMHGHMELDDTSRARFRQEAEAVSKLSHAGIVSVSDYGITADGTPFLVMDVLSGTTLSTVIEKEGRLDQSRLLQIFIQASDALAHAHEKGVIHRDLKPSNFMLTANSENGDAVKVVDFGIAKVLNDQGATASVRITQTGETLGSPLYMSPEQCLAREPDRRSDIYSLGCVLYEAATGQPPFQGQSVYETLHLHMHGELPPFTKIAPQLGKFSGLERVAFKCLAKDPAQRYQTMRELKADLETIRDTPAQDISIRFRDRVELLRLRGVPKRIATTIIGVVAALIFVTTGIAGTFLSGVVPSFQILPDNEIFWPLYQDNATPEKSDRLQDFLVLKLQEPHLPNQPLELVEVILTKASVLKNSLRYPEAVPLYNRAITAANQCKSAVCGDMVRKDKLLAKAYGGMGDCYYHQSLFSPAGAAYIEKDSILERSRADRPWLFNRANLRDVVQTKAKIADCFYFQKKFQEAQPYFEGASGLIVQNHDHSHGPLIQTETKVYALFASKCADLERRMGRFDVSEACYLDALESWKKNEGEDRNFALCADGLARAYTAQGKAALAHESYVDAMKAIEKIRTCKDAALSFIVRDYASFLWHTNRWLDAVQMQQSARKFD